MEGEREREVKNVYSMNLQEYTSIYKVVLLATAAAFPCWVKLSISHIWKLFILVNVHTRCSVMLCWPITLP